MLKKIIAKFKILFSNPALFFKICKDYFKLALFGLPKEPLEGKRFSTELEVKTLQKYAQQASLGIVEIGVLDGLTTKEIAKVSNVPIYGIDPIIPDSMNPKLSGSEDKIRKNLEFYPKFEFFKEFSYNLAGAWQKPFDFIFIDGDHEYTAVKKDFEDWFKLIVSGGFVAFHDSAPVTSVPGAFEGWAGPIRLVKELKEHAGLEFLETQDSLSVFRKK